MKNVKYDSYKKEKCWPIYMLKVFVSNFQLQFVDLGQFDYKCQFCIRRKLARYNTKIVFGQISGVNSMETKNIDIWNGRLVKLTCIKRTKIRLKFTASIVWITIPYKMGKISHWAGGRNFISSLWWPHRTHTQQKEINIHGKADSSTYIYLYTFGIFGHRKAHTGANDYCNEARSERRHKDGSLYIFLHKYIYVLARCVVRIRTYIYTYILSVRVYMYGLAAFSRWRALSFVRVLVELH